LLEVSLDLALQGDRIEGQVESAEPLFGILVDVKGSQDTLIGCLGSIILLAEFAAHSRFLDQFHDRLEEVDEVIQVGVDGVKQGKGLIAFNSSLWPVWSLRSSRAP
jgi:hypothetical protein